MLVSRCKSIIVQRTVCSHRTIPSFESEQLFLHRQMTFRRNDHMSQDVHADQYRIAACPYHPSLEQLISLRIDDHRKINTVPEHIGSLIRKDMY